jgi:hypothetical protein
MTEAHGDDIAHWQTGKGSDRDCAGSPPVRVGGALAESAAALVQRANMILALADGVRVEQRGGGGVPDQPADGVAVAQPAASSDASAASSNRKRAGPCLPGIK